MKTPSDMILRLEALRRRRRRGISAFFGAAALLWYVLRALNRSVFVSGAVEAFLSVGIYVWLGCLIAWIALLMNPLLAQYVRRRREGSPAADAMLFGAKRPFTGSVWGDAAIFLVIVAAGAGLAGYLVHQVGPVGRR